MKYPSVFFTVLLVWLMIDIIGITVGIRSLTFHLYFLAIIFSVILFLIGFWRNKG